MPLTEEIMQTHLYDKVDEYNTLDYTNNCYKQEEPKETTTTHKIYSLMLEL